MKPARTTARSGAGFWIRPGESRVWRGIWSRAERSPCGNTVGYQPEQVTAPYCGGMYTMRYGVLAVLIVACLGIGGCGSKDPDNLTQTLKTSQGQCKLPREFAGFQLGAKKDDVLSKQTSWWDMLWHKKNILHNVVISDEDKALGMPLSEMGGNYELNRTTPSTTHLKFYNDRLYCIECEILNFTAGMTVQDEFRKKYEKCVRYQTQYNKIGVGREYIEDNTHWEIGGIPHVRVRLEHLPTVKRIMQAKRGIKDGIKAVEKEAGRDLVK